jgi:hypothetical protein
MANPASARRHPVESTAENPPSLAVHEVLVHVRYQADGEIFSIGETPKGLSAGQWLKHLLDTASPYYRTLAGGRGFFRIPRSNFESLMKLLPA